MIKLSLLKKELTEAAKKGILIESLIKRFKN